MQSRNRGEYELAGLELVAEGTDLRVQVLTLAAGQAIPWHYHSEITDQMVCLDGPMVVETRAPRQTIASKKAIAASVPPKTAHYVHGVDGGPCRFMIVQGVGVYDFVPVRVSFLFADPDRLVRHGDGAVCGASEGGGDVGGESAGGRAEIDIIGGAFGLAGEQPRAVRPQRR